PRPRPSRRRRLLGVVAITPLVAVIAIGTLIGVFGSSDGFPAATVAPRNLPPATANTVEYCRPAGVPLAMDIYTPPATARRPAPAPARARAPAARCVPGGGGTRGARGPPGVAAPLPAQDGALSPGLESPLPTRGFVVAPIDYRLAPAPAWPASIEDAKCAVRF